jgi:hypothetical protein
VALLRCIPELETLGKSRHLRISLEMAKGKAVKRCNSQVCRAGDIESACDARFHVVSGFPGEGQRENAPAVQPLAYQMKEAGGQRRGLAGSRTCQNELEPSGTRRRHPLRRIKGDRRQIWRNRAHCAGMGAATSARRPRLSAGHCNATISGPLWIVLPLSASCAASMGTRITCVSSCSR